MESVQPLNLESLALRGCCQEAWVLSGKQQVAKENQQVRARECVMSWSVEGRGRDPGKRPDSDLLGSKGRDTAPSLAASTSVPD